ncbi:MAG: hypothetical protein J7493_12585 [Porphyrobacter sp.]|nr:hypothetical protein [Porphyrobacter sp.]
MGWRSAEGVASVGAKLGTAQQRGETNPETVTRWLLWAVAWVAGIAKDIAKAEAQHASP